MENTYLVTGLSGTTRIPVMVFEEEADAWGYCNAPDQLAILANIDLKVFDSDSLTVWIIPYLRANSL